MGSEGLMVTYLSETFEGGTNGATVTTTNTQTDLITGTAPTLVNDPHDGSLALSVNQPTAVSSSLRFQLSSRTEAYVSFWIKAIGAWPTGNGSPLAIRVGSTILTDLQIPGGVLRMRGGGTGITLVYTSSATLPTDQWLLVQQHAKVTGTTQDVKVWDAAGNLLVDSGAQTWAAAATFDNVQVGSVTAIAGTVWRMDTLLASDTAVTPPVAAVTRIKFRKLANGTFQPMERYKI